MPANAITAILVSIFDIKLMSIADDSCSDKEHPSKSDSKD